MRTGQFATAVAMGLAVVGRVAPAWADADTDERRQAADDMNDPVAPKTQLRVKPSYTFPNGESRYTAELLIEPQIWYDGLLVPDLRVDGFSSIARLQLPVRSLENAQGPASGLADLTFVDVVVRDLGPLRAGLGYGTVFPMATTPALGQGKWQLGPAAVLRIDPVPWLRLANLTQAIGSVAGSSQSPDVAYVSVQPFITIRLPAAMVIESTAPMRFAWRGVRSTLPVNLCVGHAFSSRFAGELQGWYTLSGQGRKDVRVAPGGCARVRLRVGPARAPRLARRIDEPLLDVEVDRLTRHARPLADVAHPEVDHALIAPEGRLSSLT